MTDFQDIAAQVVAEDDELKSRVRGLIDLMLEQSEELIQTGTPAIKLQLMKSVIPALVKEMRPAEKNDELAELRTAMRELYASLRENVASPRPLPSFITDAASDAPPADDLPEDEAPVTHLDTATGHAHRPPPVPTPNTRTDASRRRKT